MTYFCVKNKTFCDALFLFLLKNAFIEMSKIFVNFVFLLLKYVLYLKKSNCNAVGGGIIPPPKKIS